MKTLILVSLFALGACTDKNEALVRSHVEKTLKLPESNLEIDAVELGETTEAEGQNKEALALMGLKDVKAVRMSVTFRVKEDCVAVADAIKDDVIFNEKRVSCRSLKAKVAPEKKYVKSYALKGFRRIAVFEEGKVLKAGEKFTALGELVFMTLQNGEKKDGIIFSGLKP